MDKVREQGALLPGNDKENWGNHHIDVLGYKEEEEKREKGEKRGRKGGEKRKKRKEGEIKEEEEDSDDKFKLSKANERGKLDWNNKNEEE